jgi:DNA-directed RNA polymerase subunit beta
MPWHGYNYEDAIVLSKRLVADDVLTSVHIDEFVVDARDTKLGPEEITRDIPNVSESALGGLDEDGIVRIGTRVAPGDILVGKVTLKGDVQFSPEEKLLRAIFGEKSREVRDTSLRVPPGIEGTVVDVKIFSRSGMRKDRRYKQVVAKETARLEAEFVMHRDILESMLSEKMRQELNKQSPKGKPAAALLSRGLFDAEKLKALPFEKLSALRTEDADVNELIVLLRERFDNQLRILQGLHEEQINRLKKGDPLPSGVIKMVKVYIAMKRPIQAGDKVAGRHGNKGVVSLIVPREDMPYLADGTPVDIVLNPLGVPSRMNIGQILETILGYAGVAFGKKIDAQLVQDASYKEIKQQLDVCYGAEFIKEYEKTHGKEGVQELAQASARHGVLYRTPVFDVADYEKNIKPILKKRAFLSSRHLDCVTDVPANSSTST